MLQNKIATPSSPRRRGEWHACIPWQPIQREEKRLCVTFGSEDKQESSIPVPVGGAKVSCLASVSRGVFLPRKISPARDSRCFMCGNSWFLCKWRAIESFGESLTQTHAPQPDSLETTGMPLPKSGFLPLPERRKAPSHGQK